MRSSERATRIRSTAATAHPAAGCLLRYSRSLFKRISFAGAAAPLIRVTGSSWRIVMAPVVERARRTVLVPGFRRPVFAQGELGDALVAEEEVVLVQSRCLRLGRDRAVERRRWRLAHVAGELVQGVG